MKSKPMKNRYQKWKKSNKKPPLFLQENYPNENEILSSQNYLIEKERMKEREIVNDIS